MKKKIIILSILILGSFVMVREKVLQPILEEKKQIILQKMELPKQQMMAKLRKQQRIRRQHQKLKIQEQHL